MKTKNISKKEKLLKTISSIKIGNVIKNIGFVDSCNCGVCKGSICIVIKKTFDEIKVFSSCDNKIIDIVNDDLDGLHLNLLK